eukprot:13505069-Ditylum_brightwellii.AAC.1
MMASTCEAALLSRAILEQDIQRLFSTSSFSIATLPTRIDMQQESLLQGEVMYSDFKCVSSL